MRRTSHAKPQAGGTQGAKTMTQGELGGSGDQQSQ